MTADEFRSSLALAPEAERGPDSLRLAGESYAGVSVYRIDLSDGTAYVGITSRGIADRVAEHYGFAAPWLDVRNPETLAIASRLRAGCTARVTCIASGLSKGQAQDRERQVIEGLARPLNTVHARGRTQAVTPNHNPATGAVARFL